MRTAVTIFIARQIGALIRRFRLGSGSTLPGELALRLDPAIVSKILAKNSELKVICVAGTNGKTTTSKLLSHTLTGLGKRVLTNDTGANLLNGVAGTLLTAPSKKGKLLADVAVLEVDENALPLLLKQIDPSAVLLLNLFRDQLDRYGEVHSIAERWQKVLEAQFKGKLFVNAHDPLLVSMAELLRAGGTQVRYFALNPAEVRKDGLGEVGQEADSQFCPRCARQLRYSAVAYSHIGVFSCENGDLLTPSEVDEPGDISTSLVGLFNRYNLAAAVSVVRGVFDYSDAEIKPVLTGFTPSFGRQEAVFYRKKQVIVQLSKNPTGFNQSIQVVRDYKNKDKHVLVVLNDRIPDGKDISWIWDADFERLLEVAKSITLSGDRAYELGIRFQYAMGPQVKLRAVHGKLRNVTSQQLEDASFSSGLAGTVRPNLDVANQEVELKAPKLPLVRVVPNLDEALQAAADSTDEDGLLFILPTYSAMLEVRSKITGQAISV